MEYMSLPKHLKGFVFKSHANCWVSKVDNESTVMYFSTWDEAFIHAIKKAEYRLARINNFINIQEMRAHQ